jgi:hypothetical protein
MTVKARNWSPLLGRRAFSAETAQVSMEINTNTTKNNKSYDDNRCHNYNYNYFFTFKYIIPNAIHQSLEKIRKEI